MFALRSQALALKRTAHPRRSIQYWGWPDPLKHLLGFAMEAFEQFGQVVDRHGQLEALAVLVLAPADLLQQLEVFAELQAEPRGGGEVLVSLQRVPKVADGAEVVADQLVDAVARR